MRSAGPVVPIVSVRGRATGVGSELALASDMRFANLEKAIFPQFEVDAGHVPGDDPVARLPRLIGPGRALEVQPGADDIPDDLAVLYDYGSLEAVMREGYRQSAKDIMQCAAGLCAEKGRTARSSR